VNPISVEYETLINELAEYFQGKEIPLPIQLLKIQEELGEAVQAYIGWMGWNPRKGVTHSSMDVVMELADVVITALVGIKMMGFIPDTILEQQASKARERLNDAA
jgi:hypothetical protein